MSQEEQTYVEPGRLCWGDGVESPDRSRWLKFRRQRTREERRGQRKNPRDGMNAWEETNQIWEENQLKRLEETVPGGPPDNPG